MSLTNFKDAVKYCEALNNKDCGFPWDLDEGSAMSLPLAASISAIIMCIWLYYRLNSYSRGTGDLGTRAYGMNELSDEIQQGAKAFLITEYKYLCMFSIFVFAALVIIFSLEEETDSTDGIRMGGGFVVGASLSATAGWIGMMVATDANVRTTEAARAESGALNQALKVAFTGGSVMGFTVVGLGLFGISFLFPLLVQGRDEDNLVDEMAKFDSAINMLTGFGFGASSIALFARVAGGIFTKAADVGADLVGKVENDIPEDDPRNPAVIADNVGDNVGDVAGMGADLFESYVGSIIAASALADGNLVLIAYPYWIASAGIFASAMGFFAVSIGDKPFPKEKEQSVLMHALHKGIYASGFLILVFSAIITYFLFDYNEDYRDAVFTSGSGLAPSSLTGDNVGWKLYGCIIVGLVAGFMIGEGTEYFTSYSQSPVKSIAAAGITGPATVIIQGLGVGMISCIIPTVVICATILITNELSGDYGVAISAVGMLSTLGVTLATDAYGPVADNAGGIAEMAELPESVRETTDALDALGNTTAATGKGFAIGSAVLTSLSLLNAFADKALEGIDGGGVQDAVVLSGVIFGAMLPFIFSALTMLSVGKAAKAIIQEVRHQFNSIAGLREGKEGVRPNSGRCVEISTISSIQEMILPGLYAIMAPLFVGFLIGPKCLTGMLGGAISSGAMMAIMMSNAGGAWDNSKKYIEIEKSHGGKGTDIHKACVVGDTVGDPFKDTSGPALNILIKLMSMISLLVAPLIKGNGNYDDFAIGFAPLALGLIGTVYVYMVYWKDEEPLISKNKDETSLEKI